MMLNAKQVILAVETSTSACSAALLLQQQHQPPLIYECWEDAPRRHTDLILPMIEDVLAQADLELSDVTKLAFGCGPGAFTGVRIATSVIQALSYAARINAVPISSLAALAQGMARKHDCRHLVVANDARMNEIYLGCYDYFPDTQRVKLHGRETIIGAAGVNDYIAAFSQQNACYCAVGSGWEAYRSQLLPVLNQERFTHTFADCLPQARDVAQLALHQAVADSYQLSDLALPVYLRNQVAKKPSA